MRVISVFLVALTFACLVLADGQHTSNEHHTDKKTHDKHHHHSGSAAKPNVAASGHNLDKVEVEPVDFSGDPLVFNMPEDGDVAQPKEAVQQMDFAKLAPMFEQNGKPVEPASLDLSQPIAAPTSSQATSSILPVWGIVLLASLLAVVVVVAVMTTILVVTQSRRRNKRPQRIVLPEGILGRARSSPELQTAKKVEPASRIDEIVMGSLSMSGPQDKKRTSRPSLRRSSSQNRADNTTGQWQEVNISSQIPDTTQPNIFRENSPDSWADDEVQV